MATSTNNDSSNSGRNKKDASPTFGEIQNLAKECGYDERRPSVSATLFFIERSPAYGMPPVRINVYPTTRSLMTHLNHPTAAANELWRSNAYDTLQELRTFLDNPRIHTGKGYRNARHAVRGCVQCGEMKKRTDFSNNQWGKGPDANKCADCVEIIQQKRKEAAAEANESDEEEEGVTPTLTLDALEQHNNTTASIINNDNTLERRQFNCPACPQHGRGVYVFFKKVPALKPLVKCPQCKTATRGRCSRIYPIPRQAERGYGLFRCRTCQDKWGSSRAVANVGQECFTCVKQGRAGVMVTPFRLEVVKKNKTAGGRGGPRGMRRVPREPIPEDQEDEREYTPADGERNTTAGGAGGVSSSAPSYDLEPRDKNEPPAATRPAQKPSRIPEGYRHKCAGCAKGLCKRRSVPKSQVHDVSDGDTISTRASVVTNSSVDKSEFVDRDEDFSGFLLEEENDQEDEGDWVPVYSV